MFIRRFFSLFTVLLIAYFDVAYADSCPTPDIIKERKISREYAWLIDERRTLDDVLAVEKLYSARIRGGGEFVTCYYSGNNLLLEMDAKPIKEDCGVTQYKGNWETVNNDELVCAEPEPRLCEYAIYCDETSERPD